MPWSIPALAAKRHAPPYDPSTCTVWTGMWFTTTTSTWSSAAVTAQSALRLLPKHARDGATDWCDEHVSMWTHSASEGFHNLHLNLAIIISSNKKHAFHVSSVIFYWAPLLLLWSNNLKSWNERRAPPWVNTTMGRFRRNVASPHWHIDSGRATDRWGSSRCLDLLNMSEHSYDGAGFIRHIAYPYHTEYTHTHTHTFNPCP